MELSRLVGEPSLHPTTFFDSEVPRQKITRSKNYRQGAQKSQEGRIYNSMARPGFEYTLFNSIGLQKTKYRLVLVDVGTIMESVK